MQSLTVAKRDQTRRDAEQSIKQQIGAKPTRDQFNNYVASRFPRWFKVMIGCLLFTVALAAGLNSGVRLYVAGFNQVRDIMPYFIGRVIIGGCTVLAAELLVILATVAGQVYLHGKQKGIAAVPIIVGTSVAFVGNWSIIDPSSMWGWVETAYPPIAVLSVAFFFEISLVPELERRQADNNAFELARSEWQTLFDNVEDHPDWPQTWATVIREELVQHNGMSVDDLTPGEWRAAVEVEMNAEQWWHSSEFSVNAKNAPVNSGRAQIEIAVDFLRENPTVFNGLLEQTLQQSDAAYQARVSQSTMSRAFTKVRENGHES